LNAQKEEALVEFRVLGPLEVRAGDGVLSLGAPKQRAVLGVLLLRRNELVRTETLVDEVWGDRPPASVSKILQGHVWRLRRALGAAVIETQPLGYLLRVDKGTLDVDRFEDLLERGRTLLADGAATEARTSATRRSQPRHDLHASRSTPRCSQLAAPGGYGFRRREPAFIIASSRWVDNQSP
jgi:DNA-binding SARP family transcriptional activator